MMISFLTLILIKKSVTYLILTNDSLEIFGDSIYHPLWNPANDFIIFNRARQMEDSIYSDKKIIHWP